MSDASAAPVGFPARFRSYLAVRFPIGSSGLAALVFSVGTLLAWGRLSGAGTMDVLRGAVAAGIVVGMFLLLRICDEHKDADDDARFRPERPVPSGLVTLAELRWVGAVVVLLQSAGFWMVAPDAWPFMFAAWGWMALMAWEFGAGERLRRHPVVYLFSHMAIMPLLALVAMAVAGPAPVVSAGVCVLLAMAFLSGLFMEIGRKIQLPGSEREGVETYSSLWGYRMAVFAWSLAWIAFWVSFITLLELAGEPGLLLVSLFHPVLLLVALIGFVSAPVYRIPGWGRGLGAKPIQAVTGLAILLTYVAAGALPWLP